MLAGIGSGCFGPGADRVAVSEQGVIYAEDGRREVFEEHDARVRDFAESSTAAVVLRAAIAIDGAGAVAIDAPSAMEAFDLCADEPFATQPSAALCTAVLVAPDVALTAGHCLSWMSCSKLALVFGYHYVGPEALGPVLASDVYECAEVLALEVSSKGEPAAHDFAFVSLSRPVAAPRHPALLALEPDAVRDGDTVTCVGHSEGLPTKVAHNGLVTATRNGASDNFLATVDNFLGGSGSGVLDEQGRLVGVATGGAADFASMAPETCARARHVAADVGQTDVGEKIGRLAPMRDVLCARTNGAAVLCDSASARHGAGGPRCQVTAVGLSGGLAALGWWLAALTLWVFRRAV